MKIIFQNKAIKNRNDLMTIELYSHIRKEINRIQKVIDRYQYTDQKIEISIYCN